MFLNVVSYILLIDENFYFMLAFMDFFLQYMYEKDKLKKNVFFYTGVVCHL